MEMRRRARILKTWNRIVILMLKSDAENIDRVQVGALLDLVYTGICYDPGDIEPSGELALLSLYR